MDASNNEERIAEHRRQLLDKCRGRRFVRRVFKSYPSLRSIEPDEEGYYYSVPYTGQEYDPAQLRVCEDGWDHEHCYVCWADIDPGDDYWHNDDPWDLELCLACYEHLAACEGEQGVSP
jgi:hypothetical protein